MSYHFVYEKVNNASKAYLIIYIDNYHIIIIISLMLLRIGDEILVYFEEPSKHGIALIMIVLL